MKIFSLAKRSFALWSALILATASLIPVLMAQEASAYGLITTRFIKMSSSKASDTDVTYNVSFATATAGNPSVGGMVINFCSTSPIIGDTCTAPSAAFKLHAKTADNTLVLANQAGVTDWQKDLTGATDNLLVLSRTGGAAAVTTGTTVSLDLGSSGGSDGVDNPSTTGTFYARILLYDTQAHAEAYTATAAGGGTGAIDAGGIALSTAAQITITSKVQERLNFCIYTGANCGAGGSSVTLGDTNGVLDPAGAYVDKNTKFDLSSNASSGVAVRVKGDTLKSGSFDITAIGASAAASSPGSEQFGFCAYQSTGSGLTPAAPYNHANCSATTQTAGTGTPGGDGSSQFAFDTANTNTTYGQTFANKPAGATSQGTIAFIGNIANTTEAGIYTTTLTFVATGTY
jgi:hypothetical protein